MFDTDGTEATLLSEVQQFEAVYGDLSLPQRLLLALYKVFYGVLVFCVGESAYSSVTCMKTCCDNKFVLSYLCCVSEN